MPSSACKKQQHPDVVQHAAESVLLFFFFNDTPTTEIYTLPLHDALPIWSDCWDLEVRGGFFGAARLLLAVEDHPGGQLVRLRSWPDVPARGPLFMLG